MKAEDNAEEREAGGVEDDVQLKGPTQDTSRVRIDVAGRGAT
jgi:hypothetical protein